MTALITPFRNGAADEAAFIRLCERQIARGTTALIICGSTGEAAAMQPEEQAALVALAVATATRRVPVVAGCQAPATEAAVALANLLMRAGADALLCAPTPYVKPTQQGIICHMRALAHAADRPLVLYDVPSRVGVGIADATVATLFKRGIIHAIKDATADVSRVARLRALCGAELAQFSGDDATAAAYRAAGGGGCISVTANLTPALCSLLHRSWDAVDLRAFANTCDLLAPLHEALFLESNPIPLKAALGMLDLAPNELRLPLTRASQPTRDRLAGVLPAVMDAEDGLATMLPYNWRRESHRTRSFRIPRGSSFTTV